MGSGPSEYLLKKLKPAYWFSAHLHVKFAAIYHHTEDKTSHISSQLEQTNENSGKVDHLDAPSENNDIIEQAHDSSIIPNTGEELNLESKNINQIDTNQNIAISTDKDVISPPPYQSIAADSNVEECDANSSKDMVPRKKQKTIPDTFNSPGPNVVKSCVKLDDDHFPETTRFLALDKCLPGKHFLQV